MKFIRQGATHKVVMGPAVAVANGYVPVTSLTLSGADEAEVILHDNGTVVDISGYTWAAITTADGYYHLTLQSGISNTVGHVTVVVNDDSLILPLREDFMVVEEAVYDALYAASAPGFATVAAVTTIDGIVDDILLDTAEIGTAGAGLTNINLPNQTMDIVGNITGNLSGTVGSVTGAINTAAGVITTLDALDTAQDSQHSTTQTAVADVPTNSELATALAAADDAVLAAIAALNNLSSAGAQSAVTTALTTALTEGYRGTGATGSVRDLLYEVIAHLGESSISSTTKTLKKLDASTTAKTYTLDSATTPTSITETT